MTDQSEIIKALVEALAPLADAVFNDNGDMTVHTVYPTSGQCIAAYFARKTALALAKSAQSTPPAFRDTQGHRTRMSDSSLYDEVCLYCGARDHIVHDTLRMECTATEEKKAEVDKRMDAAQSQPMPSATQDVYYPEVGGVVTEYAPEQQAREPHKFRLFSSCCGGKNDKGESCSVAQPCRVCGLGGVVRIYASREFSTK